MVRNFSVTCHECDVGRMDNVYENNINKLLIFFLT